MMNNKRIQECDRSMLYSQLYDFVMDQCFHGGPLNTSPEGVTKTNLFGRSFAVIGNC
jgi:hypothetical protein